MLRSLVPKPSERGPPHGHSDAYLHELLFLRREGESHAISIHNIVKHQEFVAVKLRIPSIDAQAGVSLHCWSLWLNLFTDHVAMVISGMMECYVILLQVYLLWAELNYWLVYMIVLHFWLAFSFLLWLQNNQVENTHGTHFNNIIVMICIH